MGVGLCTEQGEKDLRRGHFIRSSSEHKEARQKLDYWEMEVSCRVTVTVLGGGRDSEMIPSQSSFISLDEEEMPPPPEPPEGMLMSSACQTQ